MATTYIWLKNPFVMAVLLIAFTVVDLILLGRALELSKSDWASWVQAVGSIGAIIVAFVVADASSRRARAQAHEMERRQIDRKHQSICAILDDAVLQCQEILCEAELSGTLNQFSFLVTYDAVAFAAVLTSIQAIPLHELSGYSAVRGISALRNAMITLQRQVDIPTPEIKPANFFDSPTEEEQAFEELRLSGRRMAAIEAAKAAHSAYIEATVALGGTPSTVAPHKYIEWVGQIQESQVMTMNAVNEALAGDAI
jgi:hypothetical protein